MDNINIRFREVRKKLDVSQEEFAAKANRTRSEITNIEYGKTSPKPEVISAVCSAWNVNESWLRSGAGEMFVPVSRDEEITDFMGRIAKSGDEDFRRRLVSVLCRLDTAEWELLEKMALKLAAEYGKEDQA